MMCVDQNYQQRPQQRRDYDYCYYVNDSIHISNTVFVQVTDLPQGVSFK
jgi:hypothetical protein